MNGPAGRGFPEAFAVGDGRRADREPRPAGHARVAYTAGGGPAENFVGLLAELEATLISITLHGAVGRGVDSKTMGRGFETC